MFEYPSSVVDPVLEKLSSVVDSVFKLEASLEKSVKSVDSVVKSVKNSLLPLYALLLSSVEKPMSVNPSDFDDFFSLPFGSNELSLVECVK